MLSRSTRLAPAFTALVLLVACSSGSGGTKVVNAGEKDDCGRVKQLIKSSTAVRDGAVPPVPLPTGVTNAVTTTIPPDPGGRGTTGDELAAPDQTRNTVVVIADVKASLATVRTRTAAAYTAGYTRGTSSTREIDGELQRFAALFTSSTAHVTVASLTCDGSPTRLVAAKR